MPWTYAVGFVPDMAGEASGREFGALLWIFDRMRSCCSGRIWVVGGITFAVDAAERTAGRTVMGNVDGNSAAPQRWLVSKNYRQQMLQLGSTEFMHVRRDERLGKISLKFRASVRQTTSAPLSSHDGHDAELPSSFRNAIMSLPGPSCNPTCHVQTGVRGLVSPQTELRRLANSESTTMAA